MSRSYWKLVERLTMRFDEKAGQFIQRLFENLAQADIEVTYISVGGRSRRTGAETSHSMSILELTKGSLGPHELGFIMADQMKAAIRDKKEDMDAKRNSPNG